MEYKFGGKVSLNDYISFNSYYLKNSLFKGAGSLAFWGTIFIVFFLVMLNLYVGINHIIEFRNDMNNLDNNVNIDSLTALSIVIKIFKEFPIIIFVALVLIILRVVLRKTYKKHYNSNKFYLEEQHYVVDENSIKITWGGSTTLTKEHINKIAFNKDAVYIFVALNMAYMIKSAYFSNINEFNDFKTFVSEHYIKKQNGA